MNTAKLLLALSLILTASTSLAGPQPGYKSIGPKEIKEENVSFRWMSNDGSFVYNCAAVYDKPDAWDWDVWCGKGTNMLRMYRVHLLVQQYVKQNQDKKAYEILFWITDRNQKAPKFSSTSQWIQMSGMADLDFFTTSVGVENDYGLLEVTYKP